VLEFFLLKKIVVDLVTDSKEPIFVDLRTDAQEPRLGLRRAIAEMGSLRLGPRRAIAEMRGLRLGCSSSIRNGLKLTRHAVDAIRSACAIFVGLIRCATQHFDDGIAGPIKYLAGVRLVRSFATHPTFTGRLFAHFYTRLLLQLASAAATKKQDAIGRCERGAKPATTARSSQSNRCHCG
jgi:hypothetical protein